MGSRKGKKNLKKHDVGFEEASTIFEDPRFISFLDEEHSTEEERHITIGMSDKVRLLMAAHTERKRRIRIISARKATKNEEKFYNETE
ncbi:MAG: BrnT family toxin [Chloroflexota bacterium]|nr:BrnT family toxin [Chloroflexota bacterium]